MKYLILLILLSTLIYAAEQVEIQDSFVFNEPNNISRESAFNSLIEAEETWDEMINMDLNTKFINDTLIFAKRSYVGTNFQQIRKEINNQTFGFRREYMESVLDVALNTPRHEQRIQNYTEVHRLTQLVSHRRQQASFLIDKIDILFEKEEEIRNKGLNTTEAFNLISKGNVSFIEERYDEAETYFKEGELRLDDLVNEYEERESLVKAARNFFLKYWIHILVAILIIFLIIKPFTKRIKKHFDIKKLQSLKDELKSLEKAMVFDQIACFKDKIISVEAYKIREKKHKKRMTEIKHKIPQLEGQIGIKHKKVKQGILEVK